MSCKFRLILPLFCCIYVMLNDAKAEDLSCSKNGTTLIYINGMFNSFTNASDSADELSMIYTSESAKKELDSSGKLDVDFVYQRSLYKMNSENTPLPDVVGAMSDVIQVAGQYIQDQIESRGRDDLTFWQSMASYFFNADAQSAAMDDETGPVLVAINALDRAYQGFFVEEVGDTVEEGDLQKMISRVKDRLINEQKKMIIVSHSQGNFYANKLWNRLVRDG